MTKPQYLLLEDVDGLGRSGDLVTAKPGFVNNYLEPQGKAVRADRRTLRMQARLQEERAKQAEIDKKISLEIADKAKELVLETRVKVDTEGHMYGSVVAADIEALLNEKGLAVEKKQIRIAQPIKTTGVHTIPLKLKEGVEAQVKIKVMTEDGKIIEPPKPAELPKEEVSQEPIEGAEEGKSEE